MRPVSYAKALPSSLQYLCHISTVSLLAIALLLSSGCSKRYDDLPAYLPFDLGDRDNNSVGRFKTTYLVDQIDRYYRGANPGPLGVTTFVNLDDLYTTSTFGRIYAEQMMSELAMRGFDVIELRHADALQFLTDSGEFALSRDVGALRRERGLSGVIVGTYVVSPVRVYVNARLVDPSTSMVLSAGSVEMSKSSEIARLLRGGMPTTLERIPVRHLGPNSYPLYSFTSMGRRWDEEESYGPAPVMVPSGAKGKDAALMPPAAKPVEVKKK